MFFTFENRLKREARKASLKMTSDRQISTALELYKWSVQDGCFSNIFVFFKSVEYYKTASEFLKVRFENCKTISGTRKFDYVEPE